MSNHLKVKPARLGRFVAWLNSFEPRPRPSKLVRKFTHHQERRAAVREIREAL